MVTHPSTNLYLCCLTLNSLQIRFFMHQMVTHPSTWNFRFVPVPGLSQVCSSPRFVPGLFQSQVCPRFVPVTKFWYAFSNFLVSFLLKLVLLSQGGYGFQQVFYCFPRFGKIFRISDIYISWSPKVQHFQTIRQTQNLEAGHPRFSIFKR